MSIKNRPDQKTTIYAFLDISGKPVYVGKTTMILSRRINNHEGSARRKPKAPFHKWLAVNDFNVIILDIVPFSESSAAEKRWIIRLSKRFALLNVHSHSSGNPGCGRVLWTDYALSLLGNRTDSSIAKLLGCNRQTVAYRREIMGIPRYPDPHNPINTIYLDLHVLSRLGQEPDYKIANDIGVSKFVIAKHRKKLKIPSYAVSTGNNGQIKAGEPHRRWQK